MEIGLSVPEIFKGSLLYMSRGGGYLGHVTSIVSKVRVGGGGGGVGLGGMVDVNEELKF